MGVGDERVDGEADRGPRVEAPDDPEGAVGGPHGSADEGASEPDAADDAPLEPGDAGAPPQPYDTDALPQPYDTDAPPHPDDTDALLEPDGLPEDADPALTRRSAYAIVGALIGLSVAPFFLPWQILALLNLTALALLQRRGGFLVFAAFTLTINTLLMAWLHPSPKDWTLGPIALGDAGALAGLVAGLRLTSILGMNLAAFQAVTPAVLLDAMRLPRRPYAFLAAVMLTAQGLGRDFTQLRDARRMDGDWPTGRVGQARAAAALMPALFLSAVEQAQRRKEALWIAGHHTRARFGPLVAVTGLAVAGRLALVALPNISLTYVIVFLGGAIFGWRVGAAAGAISMALTNLVLSGFFLPAYANAIGMATVGALGGFLASVDDGNSRGATMMFAAAVGIVATLTFSLVTDVVTWAMVPELRASVDRLRFDVLAGLVFNAVPAIINGMLFAASVGPVRRAFGALSGGRSQAT